MLKERQWRQIAVNSFSRVGFPLIVWVFEVTRVRPPFAPPPPRKAQWSLVSFHVAHLHVIYLDILVMRSNRTAGVWFLLALHAHSDSLGRIPWINFSFACCYLLKFQIASDVCDSSWCPFKCAAVLISEIHSFPGDWYLSDIFRIFVQTKK